MTTQLPLPKERLEKIALWRESYGDGHNVMLPAEEAEALARFALAAYEQEPVDAQPLKCCDACVGVLSTLGFSYKNARLKDVLAEIKRLKNPAPSIPAAVPEEPPAELVDFCERVIDSRCAANEKAYALWETCRAAVLQAEPSGWIPVSERLPETYVNVLLTDEHNDTCIGQLECEGDSHFYVAGSAHRYKATHWQPLPAAPKGV